MNNIFFVSFLILAISFSFNVNAVPIKSLPWTKRIKFPSPGVKAFVKFDSKHFGTRVTGYWRKTSFPKKTLVFYSYINANCNTVETDTVLEVDVTNDFTPKYVNEKGESKLFTRSNLSWLYGRHVQTVIVAYEVKYTKSGKEYVQSLTCSPIQYEADE
ncbi:hypothetical protein G9A89_014326 [Geosiphon pyriformis]|nr:hypothetical protein G9A89_014326 [Geosiphon pyriformis]